MLEDPGGMRNLRGSRGSGGTEGGGAAARECAGLEITRRISVAAPRHTLAAPAQRALHTIR